MTDTVQTNQAEQADRAERAKLTGTVRSKSGDKTISVVVDRLVKHPQYGKYMKRRTTVAVHDPKNEAGVGDIVEITFCRRLSKSKSWRLAQVVRRSVAR
jgi:small subunit ribosomal protein S17